MIKQWGWHVSDRRAVQSEEMALECGLGSPWQVILIEMAPESAAL